MRAVRGIVRDGSILILIMEELMLKYTYTASCIQMCWLTKAAIRLLHQPIVKI
jgi:hypothetical protein